MATPNLLEMEDVQFEVEKEVWNVYELDDGAMIRMRSILLKLLMGQPTKSAGPMEEMARQASIKSQNLMSVNKCPKTLMGKPNPNPIPPIPEIANMKKIEVGFNPYSEDFNVYRLPDGSKLKIKLVVSTIYRVLDLYDELGYPIYLVNSTNAIAPVPKPKVT